MGWFRAILVAALAVTFVLFSPSLLDFQPEYEDIPFPNFEGPYKENNILGNADRLHDGKIPGAEAFAVGPDGSIYTGLSNGQIVRLAEGKIFPVARTGTKDCVNEKGPLQECGRPLGLRFGKDGLLYVADAFSGLLSVDTSKGTVNTLVPFGATIDGENITFADDLDIDKEGFIYFSDASTKWDMSQVIYSFLETRRDGRVLKYDPRSKKTEVLVKDMAFPNGIQISHDGDSLLICEFHKRRIFRYYLRGQKKGQSEIFVDKLPGEPDNIRTSPRGGYWVGLMVARNSTNRLLIDHVKNYPTLTRAVVRVKHLFGSILYFLGEKCSCSPLKNYGYQIITGGAFLLEGGTGMIVELNANGKVIRSLQGPIEHVGKISHVLEHKGHIYLGSFINDFVGFLKL